MTGQTVHLYNVSHMRTLGQLFEFCKPLSAFADAVGESHWVVSKWKKRKSIPVSAWPAVIKALKRKGKDIGAAELLAMHTNSKGSPVKQSNNCGDAA